MAEYIKKALVAREIRKLLRVRESPVDIFQAGFEYGVNKAWANINKIPAADVAQVVRCKDCKHFNRREHRCESNDVHYDLEGGAEYSIGFDVDDFCCFGERKEQDNG